MCWKRILDLFRRKEPPKFSTYFVSTKSGDWDDPATWGRTDRGPDHGERRPVVWNSYRHLDYPMTSDTVIIDGHIVTKGDK